MRILFLTTLMPGMRQTGSEVATQGFVDALRDAGHEVTLLGYRRKGSSPPLGTGDVAVAERHIETEAAGAWVAAWMARAVLTRRPYSVAKYVGRTYRQAVARALSDDPPDLVILDHAQMGWLLPRDGWDVPFVYLAHNVEQALHEGMVSEGRLRRWAHARESRRIGEVEAAILQQAQEIWALTEGDARALTALAPPGIASRVFHIAAVTVPAGAGTASHDAVTLGGWHWKPNASGLRWFVDEVLPRLADHGVEVVVGGGSGPEIVGDRPGARAVGRVPDALEFLQSGRVVVVPSIAGAGVQVKSLDAIATGRLVVATSTAMRGIADPPPTVRVADDPEAFAREVLDGLRSPPGETAAEEARAWSAQRAARFRASVADAVGGVA